MIKIQLGMSYESIMAVNAAEIIHPGTLLVKINENPVDLHWRSTADGKVIEAVVEPGPKSLVYNVQMLLKYPGCMPLIADETVSEGCVLAFVSSCEKEFYVDIQKATHLRPGVTVLAVAS